MQYNKQNPFSEVISFSWIISAQTKPEDNSTTAGEMWMHWWGILEPQK